MLTAANVQNSDNMETQKYGNTNKEKELLNVYKLYRSNILQTLSHLPFQSYCSSLTESSHVKTLVRGKHHGLCDGNSTAHAESFEYFVEISHNNSNMQNVSGYVSNINNYNPYSNTPWAGQGVEQPTRIQVEPYHRSAAGKSVDSAQMRSPLALEKSMHFLVQHYLRVPHVALVYTDPFKIWGYLWDRWRGIRTTWIPQLPSLSYSPLQMQKIWQEQEQEKQELSMNSTMTDMYTYVDDEDHSIVLDNFQLMKENHRRMAWLQFTIAALSFAGAYLCRSHEMCMRFVQEKKNFLESLSQCFTDLAVHYRSLQQRKHSEFISLLLLLYGLRQEVKAEDRALFCKFSNLSIFQDSNTTSSSSATSTWMVPEEASASVNIAQCYSELVKQPLIALTEPIRIVMEILHCWAQRDWFRFFELCRDNTFQNDLEGEHNEQDNDEEEFSGLWNKQEGNTGNTKVDKLSNRVNKRHSVPRQRLSFLQRAVLFQSFTYARFRAILDLVLPNYYVYSKLRIRHYIPINELAYLLMMTSPQECEELLVNMGLGSSLSEIEIPSDNINNDGEHITTRVLLLTDDKSQPRVTGAAIEAHCGNNKEKLFYPTFPAYFGFKVWEDGLNLFPELSAELLPRNNDGDTLNNNNNNQFSQESQQQQQDDHWNGRESQFGNVDSKDNSNKEELVSQSEEQRQQEEYNEEENNKYWELQQEQEQEQYEMERMLLEKINCPINLMELLEIYCPPYHDEVASLKLDDCDNKWFDSITRDRQKMLRVCLERHGKLHHSNKHSQQNVNSRNNVNINVDTHYLQQDAHYNQMNEEEENEAKQKDDEIDDLIAKYEQESQSTSSGVIDEMSSITDSEVDNAEHTKYSDYQNEDNNEVKSNEEQSKTNKNSICDVETNSHVRDVVQSTQEFIIQLQKDPRYALLLEQKDGHLVNENSNDKVNNIINQYTSQEQIQTEGDEQNKLHSVINSSKGESDKWNMSSVSPVVEEVKENTITNVNEASVKTPIVESPIATPMTLSQTIPQTNSTSFAIPAIANKRYISEERSVTPVVITTATNMNESSAKTTTEYTNMEKNKANEISRVFSTSSKTPIVISASSSSSSSSSLSRKRSPESLETEDFEESEEEEKQEEEEKSRNIHTLKKQKIEEVEPIAITPANTKTTTVWPLASTTSSSNTFTETAKSQPILNLNDAPLLSSVVKDNNASSPFSWQPSNNFFKSNSNSNNNIGFGSSSTTNTNNTNTNIVTTNTNLFKTINNNNNYIQQNTGFAFGSWSSPTTNMSWPTPSSNNNDNLNSSALALSPISKHESVDRSISPNTLGVNNEVEAINAKLEKALPTSQSSTSSLMFMAKMTDSATENVQVHRKRSHDDIEEEEEEEEIDAQINSVNFMKRITSRIDTMNNKMNWLAWQYMEANSMHDNNNDHHQLNTSKASLSRWSLAIDVNHLHERCTVASEQLQTSLEHFLKHVYVRLFALEPCFSKRSVIHKMSKPSKRVQRAVQCALLLSEINASDYTEWLKLWNYTADNKLEHNKLKATTQEVATQTLFTFEQQVLRFVCRGFTLSLTNYLEEDYNSFNNGVYNNEKGINTMKHFQEQIARITKQQLQRLDQIVNKNYGNKRYNNKKQSSDVSTRFFKQLNKNAHEINQVVNSHFKNVNKYNNRGCNSTLPIVKFTFSFVFAIAHNNSHENNDSIITFNSVTDKCMMQCIRLISTYVVSNPLQHITDSQIVKKEKEDDMEESVNCNSDGCVTKYHELLFSETNELQQRKQYCRVNLCTASQSRCSTRTLMSTCIQYDICDAHNLPSFFKNNNICTESTNVSLCNSVTLVTFLSDTDHHRAVKGNSNKVSKNFIDDDVTNVNECKQLMYNVQNLAKHVFQVNFNKEHFNSTSNCTVISGVVINVCLHVEGDQVENGNTSSQLQKYLEKLQETLTRKFWDAWAKQSTSNVRENDVNNGDRSNSIGKVKDDIMYNAVKPTLVIVPMFLSNCVEAFVRATETMLEKHKIELDGQIYSYNE